MSTSFLSAPLNVLVVDDEPGMRRYMQTLLEVEGHRVATAANGPDALEKLGQDLAPDITFLDLLMPGLDGLQTLEQIRQFNRNLKVVMLSCVNDSRKVARAIRLGAVDYLNKPFGKKDLDAIIEPLTRPRNGVKSAEVIEDLGDGIFFLTATPQMHKLRAQAELVAQVDIPVLLLGESGTGKEVFARLIHHSSPRARYPFLKVNCAAIPAELLESELFGYEAGAFTGATRAKPGKFEACDKGTIFLDEIGEMPPGLQAKLLHVLQDQQFSRLGARSVVKTDVRMVAATNIDINQALTNKTIRQDLYYRLNGFTLLLPPLRERKADIPLLLKHFIRILSERFACPPPQLPEAAIAACTNYSWPGNVRELENFVKRCLVLGEFDLVTSDLTTNYVVPPHPAQISNLGTAVRGLKSVARSAKEQTEAEAILSMLEETNWNRRLAAARLKISYKTMLYKVRVYQLERLNPSASIPVASADWTCKSAS